MRPDNSPVHWTRVTACQTSIKDVIGSLEAGTTADLAIWQKTLRDNDPGNMIEEALVAGTMPNSEFTHRDGM
ncbi:hypothetical protein [Oceanomicrobium pacificus]|uniref:Amidohydrolase family protein n=1 Tax=Oceanomicrobium pacificus TaxID=2692916 RepID=A0A6B0TY77_9RHOB|nr:hypothetical protein [Oceanomicrobium pacificus]MXU65953.1 hypothetical protein [Oceanomicrobium pacificus]